MQEIISPFRYYFYFFENGEKFFAIIDPGYDIFGSCF